MIQAQPLKFEFGNQEKTTSSSLMAPELKIPKYEEKEELKKQEENRQILALEGMIDENEYIVGPLDVFLIYIWGEFEEQHILTVAADGYLLIPYVGPLKLEEVVFS